MATPDFSRVSSFGSRQAPRAFDPYRGRAGSDISPLQLVALAAAGGVAFGVIVVLTLIALTGFWGAT